MEACFSFCIRKIGQVNDPMWIDFIIPKDQFLATGGLAD